MKQGKGRHLLLGWTRLLKMPAHGASYTLVACASLACAGAIAAAFADAAMMLVRDIRVRAPHDVVLVAVTDAMGSVERLSTDQLNAVTSHQGTLAGVTAYSLWPLKLADERPVLAAVLSSGFDAAVFSDFAAPLHGAVVHAPLLDRVREGRLAMSGGASVSVTASTTLRALPFEPDRPVDLWLPLEHFAALARDTDGAVPSVTAKWLTVFAWVRSGQSAAAAAQEWTEILRRSHLIGPSQAVAVRSARHGHPWRPAFPPAVFAGLAILSAVLVVALAANLTTLGAVRAVQHERRVAIAVAVGATPKHMLRDAFRDWMPIALIGGALGGIAGLMLEAVLLRVLFGVVVDVSRAASAAFLASMTLGLLLGIPVVFANLRRSRSVSVIQVLMRNGPGASGISLSRFRRILTVQFLCAGLLLAVGFWASERVSGLTAINLGFQPQGRYMAPVKATDSLPPRYDDVLAAVESIAGVSAATIAEMVPLGEEARSQTVIRLKGDAKVRLLAMTNSIGPRGMHVLGTRLIRGRDFTAEDRLGSTKVAIVNETLARRLWGEADPLHDQLRLGGDDYQIVGVVETGKYASPVESDQPFVYVAVLQHPLPRAGVLIVRADGEHPALTASLGGVADSLRRSCCHVGPVTSMTSLVDRWLQPLKIVRSVLLAGGLMVTLLVVHGVFCAVVVSIGSSRRELAIRQCLGATRRSLVHMTVRRVALMGLPAALVGTLLALVAGGLVSRQIPGAGAFSSPAVGGTLCLIIGGASLAAVVAVLITLRGRDAIARQLA